MNWKIEKSKFVEEVRSPTSFFLTELNAASVGSLRKKMDKAIELEQGIFPIWIESEGGDVCFLQAILSIMTAARRKGLKIATITAGEADSAAAFIFCFGDEGLRFMGDYSRLMIHGFQIESIPEGRASEQREFFEELMKEEGELLQVISVHLKGPRNKKWLGNELSKRKDVDWYLDAKQALKEGIASSIGLPTFTLKLVPEINFEL